MDCARCQRNACGVIDVHELPGDGGQIQSIRQILVDIEKHSIVEVLLGHGRSSQVGFDASEGTKGPFPSCSGNRVCSGVPRNSSTRGREATSPSPRDFFQLRRIFLQSSLAYPLEFSGDMFIGIVRRHLFTSREKSSWENKDSPDHVANSIYLQICRPMSSVRHSVRQKKASWLLPHKDIYNLFYFDADVLVHKQQKEGVNLPSPILLHLSDFTNFRAEFALSTDAEVTGVSRSRWSMVTRFGNVVLDTFCFGGGDFFGGSIVDAARSSASSTMLHANKELQNL